MKKFNILGYTFGKEEELTWAQKANEALSNFKSNDIKASFFGESYPIIETVYDGEKTQGELGAPLSYLPDYNALSFRSWQAFTESDLAQIIVKAHVNWVIGSGLKLQSEPIIGVIEQEGFNFDKDDFVKTTEERFRLYSKTKDSTYTKMYNYNKSQKIAYLNALVGGDILCIDQLENGLPVKRLTDGIFIRNPNMDDINKVEARGNQIVHGVEVNKRGEHVSFFVSNKDGTFTRILARGKNTGRLQAYLYYGSEYRIDSVRGMPYLSAVLEKMKKLDRYNEAIVAGCEESAKVPYVFKHDQNSDGTNPDLAKIANTITGEDAPTGVIEVNMKAQTSLVKRTYEKDAINLPVGTSMEKLTGGMEINQEAFTTGNFIYMCAAAEIPYEVALMKYVNSFSSSRMASQSWLQILKIKRVTFTDGYNKPFYNLFLDSQILSGKIKADGYLTALNKNDVILMEAYRNCRFTGPGVPQADPSKEVKAEVLKVQSKLTTREEAIERLGGSDDFETVLDKLANEQSMIDEKLPDPEPEENTEEAN